MIFNVPLTLAVLVQLYRIANSPNTFPGPIVESFVPSFVTSTFPSKQQNHKMLGSESFTR